MKLIKTFDVFFIQEIFAILLNNEIISTDKDTYFIFENMFKDKSKGSFLCMSSLCLLKMEYKDVNRIYIDLKPLINTDEYPKLKSSIYNSMIDIQNYFTINFKDVKITDTNFMESFDEKYKKFKSADLNGFIWNQLSDLYEYISEIKNKINYIENNLIGHSKIPKEQLNEENDLQDLIKSCSTTSNNTNAANIHQNNIDMQSYYRKSYKQLDANILEEEVVKLLKTNNTTTNLDIKQAVRAQGFWATQEEISDMMSDLLGITDKFYSTNNGQFNTYHSSADDEDDDNNDPIIGTLSSSATGTSFLPTGKTTLKQSTSNRRSPKNSFVPPKSISAFYANTGDWRVTSVTSDKVNYYTGSLTREQARFSYHKECGVNYHDTRSTKIK